jgi:hypothetical protein
MTAGPLARIFALALLIAVGWTATACFRHLAAETHCSSTYDMIVNRDLAPSENKIRAAIAWDGANAAYWYKLALARIRSRSDDALLLGPTTATTTEIRQQIQHQLETAVALNPYHPNPHISLGWIHVEMVKGEPAGAAAAWEVADLAFDRAMYFIGPGTPDQHLHLGYYWLLRSLSHPPGSSGRWGGWQRTSWHYRQALVHTHSYGRKDLLQRIETDLVWALNDPQAAKKALEEVVLTP